MFLHFYIFDKAKKDLTWRILIDDDDNYLYGLPFHAAIVFGLGLDILFISILTSCPPVYLHWIFLPAVACKIQVWSRLKIKFIKLDISNWRIAKIKCR